MRWGWLAALCLLLPACGQEVRIAGTRDLSLRVTPSTRDVQSGAPFPLTIVRTWKKSLVPKDVDAARFAPLVLTLESSTRREDKVRVEETLRYRAYAFARSDVVVPAQRLAAAPAEGGVERVVSAPAFRLRVSPAVDQEEPGPPELPGPPLRPARGSPWPYVVGALLLVGLLLTLRLRRGQGERVESPEPAPPAPPPSAQALAALVSLRARVAEGAVSGDPALFELGDVLRRYVGASADVVVEAKTSREVLDLAATQFSGTEGVGQIEAVLATEELAKFARQPAGDEDVATLLAGAVQLVEQQQVAGEGGA